MARKSKAVLLSDDQRQLLEQGYKESDHHCFRQRCKMVLLKTEGYTSKQIAAILDTNEISVHNWLKRYAAQGLEGLNTSAGQGRKPILEQAHLPVVRAAVEQERQRLSQAQKIIENTMGKKMSQQTLIRFLKNSTAVTNASESDQRAVVIRCITNAKSSSWNCWSSKVSRGK
jgi:transposase